MKQYFIIAGVVIIFAVVGMGYWEYHQTQIDTTRLNVTTTIISDQTRVQSAAQQVVPTSEYIDNNPQIFLPISAKNGWNTGLVKDKNHVYWQMDGVYKIIPDADPLSFFIVYDNFGKHIYPPSTTFYTKDKDHVWIMFPAEMGPYFFNAIREADPVTFTGAEGKGYDAQDKSNKYNQGEIVK